MSYEDWDEKTREKKNKDLFGVLDLFEAGFIGRKAAHKAIEDLGFGSDGADFEVSRRIDNIREREKNRWWKFGRRSPRFP